MERNQILIIAGAFVVVAFIGFQIFAGSGDFDEGLPLSRARNAQHANAGDEDGDSGSSGVGGERYASSGRTGGEGSRRGGGTGVAGRGEGSRRDGTGAGSRLSQMALARRGERGGSVGTGTGGRGGEGSGGANVFGGGSRRLDSAGAPHRSDMVEYLASQPSAQGRGHSDDSSGSEDGEVALELKRPEDADSAGVKKDVEAPDASDEGLTFTEGSQLAFPDGGNVNGEQGTISFQIEPNWNGNDETNNSLVTLRDEHGWSNRIELVKNGRYLRFILSDNVGREADISVPIDAWSPGESHDVQATWGSQQTALYIDGVKVGQNTYTEFIRPDAPLYIGSDHKGSTYSGLNGTLRNFKVTNSSTLTPSS